MVILIKHFASCTINHKELYSYVNPIIYILFLLPPFFVAIDTMLISLQSNNPNSHTLKKKEKGKENNIKLNIPFF